MTVLFTLIPIALTWMAWLNWYRLPKAIAGQKPLRGHAATVALAAASIQILAFIGFGVYGENGGFSRSYDAFYVWAS